jgi:hypothetical protein
LEIIGIRESDSGAKAIMGRARSETDGEGKKRRDIRPLKTVNALKWAFLTVFDRFWAAWEIPLSF